MGWIMAAAGRLDRRQGLTALFDDKRRAAGDTRWPAADATGSVLGGGSGTSQSAVAHVLVLEGGDLGLAIALPSSLGRRRSPGRRSASRTARLGVGKSGSALAMTSTQTDLDATTKNTAEIRPLQPPASAPLWWSGPSSTSTGSARGSWLPRRNAEGQADHEGDVLLLEQDAEHRPRSCRARWWRTWRHGSRRLRRPGPS